MAADRNRIGGRDLVLHDEAGEAVLDDFRHGAALYAITGVPQAIASIITRPNGSGQAIGTRSAIAPLRKLDFSASPISPMYSMPGRSSCGSISRLEIFPSTLIDLGGNLSGSLLRTAMRIARSTRFSGAMRPNTAR